MIDTMKKRLQSDKRQTALDAGLIIGLCTALPVLALALLGNRWPEALFQASLGDSQILIGCLGAIIGALVYRVARGIRPDRLAASLQIVTALVLTSASYAVVQGVAVYRSTAPGREARETASSWQPLLSLDFNHPVSLPSKEISDFGTGAATQSEGHLDLSLATKRDYTYWYPESGTPAVRDFHLEATITHAQGSEDSYCGLLFGWRDNEHWYAVKLGRTNFEVTRNPGSLPHEPLDGIRELKELSADTPNRVAILALAGRVTVYINDRQVALLDGIDTFGQIRLAGQAAHLAQPLRCSFDDVRLRGVPVA
ncbi:hypothetical protein [Luedemannella helvata]